MLEVCERASGARMHTAMYRPFSVDTTVLSRSLFQDIIQFLTRCSRSLAGAFLGLLQNRSFKTRLSYIGQVSSVRATVYGISGILARSSGFLCDLRLQDTAAYRLYRSFSLRTFLGRRGDNYDRFLIRIKETAEGFRLLSQVIQTLSTGSMRSGFLGTLGGGFMPLTLAYCARTNCLRAAALGGLRVIFFRSVATTTALFRVSSTPISQQPAPHIQGSSFRFIDMEPWAQRGKFASMEAVIAHFKLASSG